MEKKDIEFLYKLRCNKYMRFKVIFIFLVVSILVRNVFAQETPTPTLTPTPIPVSPTQVFELSPGGPTIPFSDKPDVGGIINSINAAGQDGTLHNRCIQTAKSIAVFSLPNLDVPVIGGGLNLLAGALNGIITPLVQTFNPQFVTAMNQLSGNILCTGGSVPSDPYNIASCVCQDPRTFNLEGLCTPLRWQVQRQQDILIVANDGLDGSDKEHLKFRAVVPIDQNVARQVNENLPQQFLHSTTPTPATRLVEKKDLSEYNSCIKCSTKGIWTGIGCIDFSLPDLIQHKVFGYGLGLGGLLTMFGIIISAFQIQTSQGNPEKIKKAQERLTSFVIGLLVIIFSIFILRVIGVDLLRIPGFK
jgi:hypothetical protein